MTRITYILRSFPKKTKIYLFLCLSLYAGTINLRMINAKAINFENSMDYTSELVNSLALLEKTLLAIQESLDVLDRSPIISTSSSESILPIKQPQAIITPSPIEEDTTPQEPSKGLVNPSQLQSVLPQVAPESQPETVALAALKEVKAPPALEAYRQQYHSLKIQWKSTLPSDSANLFQLFFQQEAALSGLADTRQSPEALSSGELTEKALQALMFRFLIDNPSIDISNPQHINIVLATVKKIQPTSVQLDQALLKSTLLDPAIDCFTNKHKNIYATIFKVGEIGKEKYVVIVLKKDGRLQLIDPSTQHKEYHSNLLNEITTSLNRQKTDDSITFRPADESIIYTEIQGSDAGSTSSGIYAFAYWAAVMQTDSLEAFERVNGATNEETSVLDSYDSLNIAAVYSKRLKKTPGLRDADSFDQDIRSWLRAELDTSE